MAGYIGNKAVGLNVTTGDILGDVGVGGNIDVDGISNLDVVDIDGAVNMATTALVTGVLTANGGAVFNEGSADVDFRVESDDKPFCLFVNSTQDNVSIGYSAESQQSSKGLVVLSGDETGGVYIVKEDGSQPSSGEGLGSLGWRGTDDTNTMSAADAKISAFATENHDGSNSATDMRFFIKTTSQGPGNGPVETLRLEPNQNVKILDGNLVIGTAGHGIDFSAQTATSATNASTTSELLDHYEEGTCTLVVGGVGGGARTMGANNKAYYTRVGRLVTVTGTIHVTGSESLTGSIVITGIPFDADPAAHNRAAGSTAGNQLFDCGANARLALDIDPNAAFIFVLSVNDDTPNFAHLINAAVKANSTLIGFTVTYMTDA